VALEPWRSCSLLASALVQVVVQTEVSTTYVPLDVSRWTLYRTPVGSSENAVICCTLFTNPYYSRRGYYCAYALLWECCCIATNTCRLVLLRIGYRCSLRVGEFHGRLPQRYTSTILDLGWSASCPGPIAHGTHWDSRGQGHKLPCCALCETCKMQLHYGKTPT
jgi:hypothetical protein